MKKGWEIKKLGEVCEFENGDRGVNYPSKAHRTETGLPFINAGHLTSDGLDLDSMDYISRERYNLLGSGKIKKGDILFCLRGSLGKFAKIQEFSEGAIASSLVIVRPKLKVTSDFVMHYFESKICSDMIADFGNGAAQPNLSAGSLKNFEIPLPSLPEQQRIVVILNEVFEAIAKAKANAEQNLKNSKELFESYLQKVFETKGEGWEEKTLGDIGKPSMCKRILKDQTSSEGDIPFYKIGTFGKTPNAYISKDIYDLYRTKFSFPKKGDILISASGTIGRRVRYDGEPAFFQDSNIVWIDNDETQVLNDYLYVFYEFCDWQPSKGATIARLYNSNLTSIKIAFPKSLEEQKNILKKINALSSETKKLEAIYQQKINDLEELKKSVLQKAFAGELKEDLKEHFAENA